MDRTERKTLRRAVADVAGQHVDFESARDSSEKAAAILLRELLEECADAYQALRSRVVDDLDGVRLFGNDEESIVWTDDGTLALVEVDEAVRPIDDLLVVRVFGEQSVAEAAHTLRVGIEQQLRGGKIKVTKRLQRRTAMLRAIALLVANLETNELDAPPDLR